MVDPDKIKSTFMVNKEVYKRIRILALERNMEVSAIIEEAMREKLERDFPEYKPLPPMQQQPQSKYSVLSLTVNLPGIEFPANKSKIIKHAEEANSDRVVNALNKLLLNKEYKNKLDLQTELSKEAKTTKVDFAKEGRTMLFEIDDRKLRKEQYKEKSLEQENKIGIIK
jgi:hypothetical protein